MKGNLLNTHCLNVRPLHYVPAILLLYVCFCEAGSGLFAKAIGP